MTANYNPIQVYTCINISAQQWTAGECLDDNAAGGSGTQLIIEDCGGGADQRWSLP